MNTSNTPLISVIIPVYNGERYILEAVQSVLNQKYLLREHQQSGQNIEIIVVNDGSTDGTVAALTQVADQITLISQDNKGQAIARNVGLRKARGAIIGLLDGDDYWPEDHIETMLPYLINETDRYDLVKGLTQYVRMDNAILSNVILDRTEPLFLPELIGAALYRRELFDTVGLFDETMREGEDLDWTIRITEHPLREKRVDNVTLFYRRHDKNITLFNDFIAKGKLASFRRRIQRQKNRNSDKNNGTNTATNDAPQSSPSKI